MNYRDQLTQMRRDYTREAAKLDKRLDELTQQTDAGFRVMGERLSAANVAINDQLSGAIVAINNHLSGAKVAISDQLSGVVEAVHGQRAEHHELARTLQGRARLMEDRLGKMLDLVENSLDEELAEIRTRLEALERRSA